MSDPLRYKYRPCTHPYISIYIVIDPLLASIYIPARSLHRSCPSPFPYLRPPRRAASLCSAPRRSPVSLERYRNADFRLYTPRCVFLPSHHFLGARLACPELQRWVISEEAKFKAVPIEACREQVIKEGEGAYLLLPAYRPSYSTVYRVY